VTPALLIEDPGNDRKHDGDAELRGNSYVMQVVSGRPQRKYSARGNLWTHPRLGIRVHLSSAEKQQRRRGQQPFVDRCLPRSDGHPGLERGAEVVQSEQAPSGAPEYEVGLTPQTVHVGEETRRQCRRCQQGDRNNAFRGHQIKRAAEATVRSSVSNGMMLPATYGEEIKFRSRNPRCLSSDENAFTGDRYTTPSPEIFPLSRL
jgi:hypothetical protein